MLTGEHLMGHVEHKRLYLENRLSVIEVRLTEIEREKATLEAERDREREGLKNLLDYSPSHGTDFFCPDCWAKGVETVLESLAIPPRRTSTDVLTAPLKSKFPPNRKREFRLISAACRSRR